MMSVLVPSSILSTLFVVLLFAYIVWRSSIAVLSVQLVFGIVDFVSKQSCGGGGGWWRDGSRRCPGIKGDASIGLSARIFSNTGIFSKVRFAQS